jgi:hypothetical protein
MGVTDMRRALLTVLAASAAISFASPVLAAQQIIPDVTGTPDSYQVFGIASTGNVVYGSSPNNTNVPNVTFDSGVGTTVQVQVKNGAAQIDPNTGSWTSIIINPDLLFTDMKFAVSLVGGTGTVDVYTLLSGGPTGDADIAGNYSLLGTISPNGSNINWELTGDTFNGLMLVINGQPGITFGTVKQISYEPLDRSLPGVPEPSTWAMMLLGFTGVGVALRRRRKNGLAQLA